MKSHLSVVQQATAQAQATLRQFAHDPEFMAKLAIAFGSNFKHSVAAALQAAWSQGDFSVMPPIELLPAAALQRAVGAYASATDRIYLSQKFLAEQASNLGLVVSVLLEEIGHKLDCLLNVVETPGDEGDIFSRVVRGQSLSEADLHRLRAEDDWAVIVLNGRPIAVEQAVFPGTPNPDSYTGTDVADTISGLAGDDYLYGLGGNDRIDGGADNDWLDGGSGSDTLIGGDGNDRLFDGGAGIDSILGGAGNDFLQINNSTETANTTVTYTNATNGSISGGGKGGTSFRDVEALYYQSGSGNDTINVTAATVSGLYYSQAAYILGGAGNDTITTGIGNDYLQGDAGNDSLSAGAGSDYLAGGDGNDRMDGGKLLSI